MTNQSRGNALIASHDRSMLGMLLSYAKHQGYNPEGVHTLPEMLAKLPGDYTFYMMDVNLGHPNSEDIRPAQQVIDQIRGRLDQGLAKIFTFSGNPTVVDLANAAGIPSLRKPDQIFNAFD